MAKKDAAAAAPQASEALKFERELNSLGLLAILHKADEYVDMNVACVTTGFPSLDQMIHPNDRAAGEVPNVGLPLGRDIEIYSREPEVGKTSLALAFIRSFQDQGKRAVLIEPEQTVTESYLRARGVCVNEDNSGRVPLYIARREVRDASPMTAEEALDTVRNASKVADITVVDSIPALIASGDLEKTQNENDRTGGISKLLTSHCRKNVVKRSCVVWVNQQREVIGGYNPTGHSRYKSMGGMAVPFFGSVRIDLTMVGKVTVGPTDAAKVVGMKIKAYTAKNKVAPPFKSCELTYLDEEGFSSVWDWLELGEKTKTIDKSGSWYSFMGERIGQGKMSAYRTVRDNRELFAKLKERVEKDMVTV